MSKFLVFCFIAVFGVCAYAQNSEQDDRDVSTLSAAEIMRRGNMVVTTGPHSTEYEEEIIPFVTAVEPPADDSHKWYFTLVVTNNCPHCARMLKDFETHPKLCAWVDVNDWRKSWAHWRVIQLEDRSQAWRWTHYRPTKVPTLIIQPPINGAWGDPKTIVYLREGYLDPDTLDASIRAAIKQYAKKLYPNHVAWKAEHSKESGKDTTSQNNQLTANDPPAPMFLRDISLQDDFFVGQRTPPQPAPPKLILPSPPDSVPIPSDSRTFPPQADPKNLQTRYQMLNFQLDLQTVLLVVILVYILYKVIWPEVKKKVGTPVFLKEDQKNLLMAHLKDLERDSSGG